MKQKEISKIKRQFSLGNENLTVEKFTVGIVSGGELQHFKVKQFELLDDAEKIVYMKQMKESFAGKVGKALLEYPVPSENFKNNSGIQKLYELNDDGLYDEDMIKEFMLNLTQNSLYDMPICITLAHVVYNIPIDSEDAMDEDEDFSDSGNIARFLVCNIATLNFAEVELYFNEEKSELIRRKDENGSLVLCKKATDSIVYPIINDNCVDVNYVLYRTSDPKNPNTSIIENFLQCQYTMSGIDEQNKITQSLYDTFGETVDYDAIVGIKKELKVIEYQDAENPEVTQVTAKDLADTIVKIGYDEDVAEKFKKKYEENLGESIQVKSVNVLNTESTTYKTKGIKITAKQSALDRVSVENVNGIKCVVIQIEEGLKVDDILIE